MALNNLDVVCVGDAKVDVFLAFHKPSDKLNYQEPTNQLCVKFGEKIITDAMGIFLGGNAANVSVGLSKLGLKIAIVAEIGKDEFAQKIINNLTEEKVNTSAIVKGDKKTSFSVILSFNGERTIFSQHIQRDHNFNFDNLNSKWIYLTSIGENWKNAYNTTINFKEKNNFLLAFNPGTLQISQGAQQLANVLKSTEILIVNKEEGQSLIDNPIQDIKEIILNLKNLGPKIVVITDGEHGSYSLDENGKLIFQESISSNIVERTGAGDAYSSGFLAGFIKNNNIQKAMHWGALNASSCITKMGAQNGLLSLEEIERNA